jgi:hypothetical protein
MGAASNNEASSVAVRRPGCLDVRAAGMDDLSMGGRYREFTRAHLSLYSCCKTEISFFQWHIAKKRG